MTTLQPVHHRAGGELGVAGRAAGPEPGTRPPPAPSPVWDEGSQGTDAPPRQCRAGLQEKEGAVPASEDPPRPQSQAARPPAGGPAGGGGDGARGRPKAGAALTRTGPVEAGKERRCRGAGKAGLRGDGLGGREGGEAGLGRRELERVRAGWRRKTWRRFWGGRRDTQAGWQQSGESWPGWGQLWGRRVGTSRGPSGQGPPPRPTPSPQIKVERTLALKRPRPSTQAGFLGARQTAALPHPSQPL